ncbi:Protein GL2-INTERACTING REPRESSOR 1 [Hirschfeldia incana]|nr:Protein GL2-INTERACTING REPRESSOR 1 [Hirschfeldia incana]
MSRRSPKLDLKLNLSPPTSSRRRMVRSPSRSATTSPTSPPSSCVSSEMNQDESSVRYSSSPETTSMVLVGCPRCLMYVMLSEDDPKCPKCQSTVLLDFNHENATNANARTPGAGSSGRKTRRN